MKELLEQVMEKDIFKAASGYFPKQGDTGKQCSVCVLWMPDKSRCLIHGDLEVTGSMVCNLFVYGTPYDFGEMKPVGSISPEMSDLIDTKSKEGTKCGNCVHSSKPEVKTCEVVEGQIEELGCCNLWENPEEESKVR